MNLNEALSKIYAPQGMTSVLAGVMSGDLAPLGHESAVGASLIAARDKLAAIQKAQDNCGSDWAYWGYEGELAYWRAVVSLLEAAELVGADKLPDVPAPRTDGVVMDVCAHVERFGNEVLTLAKKQHAADSLAVVEPPSRRYTP